MSTGFVTPGQAYEHMLNALKGYDPVYPADTRGKLHSDVDLTVVTPQSGLCVYPDATTADHAAAFRNRGPKIKQFHLGCAGALHGPPFWLWNGVYEGDVSNKGTPAGVSAVGTTAYGVPGWVAAMPGRDPSVSEQLWGLSGLGSYELETTEFDADQTYAAGQWLRAVTLDNNANGGKVTNQNASGGAAFGATSTTFTILTDTIVGIVASGVYQNNYGKNVLAFYTYFLPGTR